MIEKEYFGSLRHGAGIYLSPYGYLGQLAGSDSFPFEVQVFTDPRALEEFCGKNRAAFLLLTQEVYREALDWEDDSWKMARLLILEEEGEAPPGLERVNTTSDRG